MQSKIIKKTFPLVLSAVFIFSSGVMADEAQKTVMQGSGIKLAKADLDRFLAFKKMDYQQLNTDQREKVLQGLFLREKLTKLEAAESVLQSEHYQHIMAEFGKELLAQLSLQAQAEQDLPDFSKRSEELYQSQLETYTEPASIKVHVLDLKKTEAATVREKLASRSLSIEQAIKDYNGKTRWIHHKNSSPVLWKAAQGLSKEHALSDVLMFREDSKLLYYVDQREQSLIPFDRVKNDIVKQLQQAYIEDQQQIIINQLKQSFKQDIQVNPIYQ